jgi:hypothetical protein
VTANFAAQGGQKMSDTHMTTPTQFLEAKGIRFAYRRFREERGGPLVFMQQFRGDLDHRDPATRNNGVLSGSRQREPQSRKGSTARVVVLMKPPASDETANVAHLQIRNFGTTKARSWALFDLR